MQGAAVAHRRSQLMLHEPLDALWETIGACGAPPRDDSMTFAAIGIALTAVAWFVTPAIVAAVFYLSRSSPAKPLRATLPVAGGPRRRALLRTTTYDRLGVS